MKFELKQYNTGVLQNFEFCNSPGKRFGKKEWSSVFAGGYAVTSWGGEKVFSFSSTDPYREQSVYIIWSEANVSYLEWNGKCFIAEWNGAASSSGVFYEAFCDAWSGTACHEAKPGGWKFLSSPAILKGFLSLKLENFAVKWNSEKLRTVTAKHTEIFDLKFFNTPAERETIFYRWFS